VGLLVKQCRQLAWPMRSQLEVSLLKNDPNVQELTFDHLATNMIYTSAPMSFIFDLLIFGHKPTLLSLVGSSMICVSAIFVAMRAQIIGEESNDKSGTGTTDEERGSYGLLPVTDNVDADAEAINVPMREYIEESPSR
jgi:hypothetical protein